MGVVWVRMGVVPIGYFGWVLFCTHWVLIHQLAAEIPDWLCFIYYYTHIRSNLNYQSNPFQQSPSPKYSIGKHQHHLVSFRHFVPDRQSTISWIESDLADCL